MKKIQLLLFVSTILLFSCTNTVKVVQNASLSLDPGVKLGKVINGYKGAKKIKWEKVSDDQGRNFVNVTGQLNAEDYYTYYYGKKMDDLQAHDKYAAFTKFNLKKYADEVMYNDASEYFNYLESLSSVYGEGVLEFNFKKSKVEFFLQFRVTDDKEVYPVYAATIEEVKVTKPDVGVLQYVDEKYDAADMLEYIYSNVPISLNSQW